MKQSIFLIISFLFICFYASLEIQAQNKNAKQKNKKQSIQQKTNDEKQKDADVDFFNFRSPIRYVIVYNEISQTEYPTRSVEILMDENAFNEKNLKQLFELLDKRFSKPESLLVIVHTSLKTIETPEERDLGNYSLEAGRLTDEIIKHKDAFYVRYENGYRRFRYTTNLSPKREKDIDLNP
jgi:hypothetical protein